jgi:hypothetical protein
MRRHRRREAAKISRATDATRLDVYEAERVTTSTTTPGTRSLRTLGAVAFVVAVSAFAGILTPIGEQYLPRSIAAMANSSGSWTLITFAAIYLSGLRGARAALMGAASFLVMNACFYLVFNLWGEYPRHYLAFWIGIAMVIGPIVGLCASWLRADGPLRRAAAVAAPSAVLIGEGIYMVLVLPQTTLYGVTSVVVGIAIFAGLAAVRLRTLATIAVSAGMCALAALLFLAVYGLTPLLLNKVVP